MTETESNNKKLLNGLSIDQKDRAKLVSSYHSDIALNQVTNDMSKTVIDIKSEKDAIIQNQQNKDKQELKQLLLDTNKIIDNISKHDNDSILVNTLKSNFENIQSTISKSNDIKINIPKTPKKTFIFKDTENKGDSNNNHNDNITNLGQQRIEKINSVNPELFKNHDEINKLSKPWMPHHQQCINKYFQSETQEKFAKKLQNDQERIIKIIKNEKNEEKPSIPHSVTIPINKTLSSSMNYTNLQSNTNSNDIDINDIEQEINDIHNKCFSPKSIKEFNSPKTKHKEIEIVGIEIPLKQYFLNKSDLNQARLNLKNKLNMKLTKKDLNRIFQNNDQKKMNIIEFNKRLKKLEKIKLNNVELKCLNEELQKINDNIDNDTIFDKNILTKYLQKPITTKPINVDHGNLKHLDTTLTLHHPFQVPLRTGTNTPKLLSPTKSNDHDHDYEDDDHYINNDQNENYSKKFNQCIPFVDFVNGQTPNQCDNDNKKRTKNIGNKLFKQSISPTTDELYKNMFSGFRKKHPQFENWWIKQFLIKTKQEEIKGKVRRKKMVKGKHSTDSRVLLKQLPYHYQYKYKFSKKMGKRITINQVLRKQNDSITPINREQVPSAGLYKRSTKQHIRTCMWSPSRKQSFICRK